MNKNSKEYLEKLYDILNKKDSGIDEKIVGFDKTLMDMLRQYIKEFNMNKSIKLINDIAKCNGKYKLICIDVDDVIYDTDRIMQDKLATLDFRSTKKYREIISKETSEDALTEINKSFAILDSILEEREYVEELENGETRVHNYPKINYSDVYKSKNLLPNAINYVNYMLNNREENCFFIYLSHRNPEREGLEKMLELYRLTPGIDAILTLPYHIEAGSKKVNSKALWVKQSLVLENLDNCILIDNSKSNCKDWRKHGGTDIRFLTDGFPKEFDLEEHLLRLPSLDPYAIQFAISCIEYIRKRENKDYLENMNEQAKTLKK